MRLSAACRTSQRRARARSQAGRRADSVMDRHGSLPHPEFLDHRPHRPWQVDAVRSHPRDHRSGPGSRHEGPVSRLDGPRTRAGHHDQGPERPRRLEGLHVPPHRHAGSRRLRLRGQPLVGGMRGRGAGGRRRPGDRGPDPRQLLSGARARPRDRRLPQQDRPPGGRPRSVRDGDRDRARHRRRGHPQDLGQDRRGCARAARRHRRADPTPGGRPRRAACRR